MKGTVRLKSALLGSTSLAAPLEGAKMNNNINALTKTAIIAMALVFLLSGCGIEEALEDLTTWDVTVTQEFFDGQPRSSDQRTQLSNATTMAMGTARVIGTADLTSLNQQIHCYIQEIDPLFLYLQGSIVNNDPSVATLTFYLIPEGGSDADKHLLGAIQMAGNEELSFNYNQGFNQHSDMVEANLFSFFASNPDTTEASLYVTTAGKGGTRATIQSMNLFASPMFAGGQPIDTSRLDEYADNVKDVGDVKLSGIITNTGETDFRFMLVTGITDEPLNFDDDVIADGFIAPGESVDVNDMVIEGGGNRARGAMKDALDGDAVEGHVLILGDGDILADVKDLQIDLELTVGL
jgi:hypothetical protein